MPVRSLLVTAVVALLALAGPLEALVSAADTRAGRWAGG